MAKYKLLWKYPIGIPVNSVSITADGRYIAVSCRMDNQVYLLENEGDRGDLLWGYGTDDVSVNSVAITPDGKYIAAGAQGSVGLHLLNREGRLLRQFDTGHGGAIFSSVAITPDGNYIAARDNFSFNKPYVYLFNTEEDVYLWKREIGISLYLPGSVSITHDGCLIAASGDNGNIYLLNGKESHCKHITLVMIVW